MSFKKAVGKLFRVFIDERVNLFIPPDLSHPAENFTLIYSILRAVFYQTECSSIGVDVIILHISLIDYLVWQTVCFVSRFCNSFWEKMQSLWEASRGIQLIVRMSTGIVHL